MVADQMRFFKKNYELLIIITILIIAAALRFYRIGDYMTFLGDEGRDMLVVKRMLVDHKFTLLGPTASVGGFFLGPLYYYFIAPFLWAFNYDPTGPAVMVALFGTATVYLVYRVGKNFFNVTAGIIAALLYAISPLIISYSRASWNPNLMPFFSLLIVYLTWLMVKNKIPIFFLWIGLSFGILFQLHYLASFLLVIIAVYCLIYFSLKRYWKYYLLGIVGFLTSLSPFLLFELRHGFPNTQSLIQFIFQSKDTGFVAGNFFPIIADVFFRMFVRTITINNNLLAILLIIFIVPLFLHQWIKTGFFKNYTLTILLIWLFFGITLFGFYQKGIYDYYFGFMFPLPFLLTGYIFSIIAADKIYFRLGVIILMLVLIYINIKGAPFWFEPNRQMANTKMVADFILGKTQRQPYNFALITGGNSDHAYRYFLEVDGKAPITIENVQVDPNRTSVTNQLFVICETLPCEPEGNSLWEIAGFGRAKIEQVWDIYVVKVYQLGHWHEGD